MTEKGKDGNPPETTERHEKITENYENPQPQSQRQLRLSCFSVAFSCLCVGSRGFSRFSVFRHGWESSPHHFPSRFGRRPNSCFSCFSAYRDYEYMAVRLISMLIRLTPMTNTNLLLERTDTNGRKTHENKNEDDFRKPWQGDIRNHGQTAQDTKHKKRF